MAGVDRGRSELNKAAERLQKDLNRFTLLPSSQQQALAEETTAVLERLCAAQNEQDKKVAGVKEREQRLAQALKRERERAVALERQLAVHQAGSAKGSGGHSPTARNTQSPAFQTKSQADTAELKSRIIQLEASLVNAQSQSLEQEEQRDAETDAGAALPADTLATALARVQAVQAAMEAGVSPSSLAQELSATEEALSSLCSPESTSASRAAALVLYSTLYRQGEGGQGRERDTLLQGPTVGHYEALTKENSLLSASLMKARTSITVAVRVRPHLPMDLERDRAAAGAYVGCPTTVVDVMSGEEVALWDAARKGWKPYAFDRVYGPSSRQEDVFTCASPLASAVLEGYTVAALAYGITGSGKTHSMTGPVQDEGIGPRLIRRVCELALADARANASRTFPSSSPSPSPVTPSVHLRVAVVEVYNEEVRDLLAGSRQVMAQGVQEGNAALVLPKLDVRGGCGEGSVSLPGVVTVDATCGEEVLAVFAQGLLARATAGTSIHEHSSRSHCILRLDVGVPSPDALSAGIPWSWTSPTGTVGRLYVVDLAGSERVAKSAVKGARLKEAQAINKSLSALGDVMEALDKKSPHVPYRNSALTHVLSDALGQAAKTVLLVNVSPGAYTAEETGFTLNFATRARRIDMGPAQRNLQFKGAVEQARLSNQKAATAEAGKAAAQAMLASLQHENGELTAKLAAASDAARQAVESARRVLADKVAALSVQVASLHGELATERAGRAADKPILEALMNTSTQDAARRRAAEEERAFAETRAADSAAQCEALRRQLLEARAETAQLRRSVGYLQARAGSPRPDGAVSPSSASIAPLSLPFPSGMSSTGLGSGFLGGATGTGRASTVGGPWGAEEGMGGGRSVAGDALSLAAGLIPASLLPGSPATIAGGPAGSPVSVTQIRQRERRYRHEAMAAAARKAAESAESAARDAIARLAERRTRGEEQERQAASKSRRQGLYPVPLLADEEGQEEGTGALHGESDWVGTTDDERQDDEAAAPLTPEETAKMDAAVLSAPAPAPALEQDQPVHDVPDIASPSGGSLGFDAIINPPEPEILAEKEVAPAAEPEPMAEVTAAPAEEAAPEEQTQQEASEKEQEEQEGEEKEKDEGKNAQAPEEVVEAPAVPEPAEAADATPAAPASPAAPVEPVGRAKWRLIRSYISDIAAASWAGYDFWTGTAAAEPAEEEDQEEEEGEDDASTSSTPRSSSVTSTQPTARDVPVVGSKLATAQLDLDI